MLGVVKDDCLEGLWYHCCMFVDIARPFVSSKHVTTDTGTGLVHVSYAHGFQDYEVPQLKCRGKLLFFHKIFSDQCKKR